MPDELRKPAFDPAILLDAEAEVVARTAQGETAVLRQDQQPLLRAAFLRHLLLGLQQDWPIRLPGVRIQGAHLEETLDLADCSGPAAAGLPALVLEACDIAAPIDISNARLARLSLRNSRIGE